MLLNNCELVPGVVTSAKDEQKLGRIKCVIPGVLDTSTMSEENLPWVYPLGMSHYQSFSKPIEGQKIWVLINKSNYNEYWYIPFHEQNTKTQEFLENCNYDDNPEVMMCRDLGGKPSIDTYDDTNGFSRRIGDDIHMNMWPDGHIELLGNKLQVDLDGDIVKCGQKDGNYEPAVFGDKLVELLKQLKLGTEAMYEACTYPPLPLSFLHLLNYY